MDGSQKEIIGNLSSWVKACRADALRDAFQICSIMAITWESSYPFSRMAPLRHEAVHNPQPLQSAAFTEAYPFSVI
jgi:hypothetical protein